MLLLACSTGAAAIWSRGRDVVDAMSDAQSLSDRGLVTIGQTGVQRWNASGGLVATLEFTGVALFLL